MKSLRKFGSLFFHGRSWTITFLTEYDLEGESAMQARYVQIARAGAPLEVSIRVVRETGAP